MVQAPRVGTTAIATLICVLASPAWAAPVYLTCTFEDGNGAAFPVELTIDEANESVSVYMPTTGNGERFRAIFRPDEVLFSDQRIRYSLSRVDLTLTRDVPMIEARDVAPCSIEDPPERAF